MSMKEVQHKVTDGVPAHSRGRVTYVTLTSLLVSYSQFPQITATKGREKKQKL